ncbi:selenide, water dikinase SelD [bacterium]|nr:selenide, water dikinase SelD [bacterium]
MEMQANDVEELPRHKIVLLGIGHTNAHVLAQWKMNPNPHANLICISNHTTATYSGMLPAVLAGQKPVSAMEIDLVQLCASANATLLVDDVVGLDREKRELQLADHPPIAFDVLSIGIGSVPETAGIDSKLNHVVTIKPMQTFLQRLERSLHREERESETPLQIVIVGGGAAGIEICCCLPGFIDASSINQRYQITLVNRGDEILSGSSRSVRSRVEKTFRQKGIEVIVGRAVQQIDSESVILDGGESLKADLVILATGATAPPLLKELGLPLCDKGFLLTDQTLRSVASDPIFAVGDTGTIQGEKTHKAGVFAVRQAPILWENIQRLVKGQTLQTYHPQHSFLRLLNTGDGSAIGEWRGISAEGKWLLSLKDRIDSTFVKKYQVPSLTPNKSLEMQCRGCGSKLASIELAAGLADLEIHHDDAAVVDVEQTQIAISTDFFTAPFRDSFLNGRIAAIHAANDLCATGAEPMCAVANVVVPAGPERMQQRYVADILAGGKQEFSLMAPGMRIVGGHTCVGPRAEIGFTVIGKLNGPSFQKANAQAGDALFLTKPLGTGVLMVAHRQAQCQAEWWTELISSMLKHSSELAELARETGVTAATDISGFGLIGHLREILNASNTCAELHTSNIPVLSGALELTKRGFRSSLFDKNFLASRDVDLSGVTEEPTEFPLLFDPQTCGGLLLCIPSRLIEVFQSKCDDAGMAVNRIGTLRPRLDQEPLVSILT